MTTLHYFLPEAAQKRNVIPIEARERNLLVFEAPVLCAALDDELAPE